MSILDTLADLGFSGELVNERRGRQTLRIRTSKGWTYEKFSADDDQAVRDWAKSHQPGVTDADAG